MKAQILMENLASIDSADYQTMLMIDDAIEYLEDTKKHYAGIAGKNDGIREAMTVLGAIILLVCGSGVDVPDPAWNYIGCAVGVGIVLIAQLIFKRD